MDAGTKARIAELKALAKAQMGRMERMGTSMAIGGLALHLADGERVDHLFGAQIDGKQAVVALTDRRLIASYGVMARSYTIDYSAINQIQTGLTKVEIEGSGVNLELKAVMRSEALVPALNERRQGGHHAAPVASTPPAATTPVQPPASAGDDPVALLARLGQLRDAGVLTDEEFASKKAEILGRM